MDGGEILIKRKTERFSSRNNISQAKTMSSGNDRAKSYAKSQAKSPARIKTSSDTALAPRKIARDMNIAS